MCMCVQFVPESARFYVVKGENLKAEKVLKRVAMYNCRRPLKVSELSLHGRHCTIVHMLRMSREELLLLRKNKGCNQARQMEFLIQVVSTH